MLVLAVMVHMLKYAPMGTALPLEELDDAGEHGIEVHQRSSACASTAATCGSQKVIAMAW